MRIFAGAHTTPAATKHTVVHFGAARTALNLIYLLAILLSPLVRGFHWCWPCCWRGRGSMEKHRACGQKVFFPQTTRLGMQILSSPTASHQSKLVGCPAACPSTGKGPRKLQRNMSPARLNTGRLAYARVHTRIYKRTRAQAAVALSLCSNPMWSAYNKVVAPFRI